MRNCLYLLVLSVLLSSFCISAQAATDPAEYPLDWLDGFRLVILETNAIPSLQRAMNAIHTQGGRIAIMSPPSILMGWIPADIREAYRPTTHEWNRVFYHPHERHLIVLE